MSDTLLDEKVITSDTPPAENRHYFRNKDFDGNLFEGATMIALCGFEKEGLAHLETDLPVCKKCKEIYESLKE